MQGRLATTGLAVMMLAGCGALPTARIGSPVTSGALSVPAVRDSRLGVVTMSTIPAAIRDQLQTDKQRASGGLSVNGVPYVTTFYNNDQVAKLEVDGQPIAYVVTSHGYMSNSQTGERAHSVTSVQFFYDLQAKTLCFAPSYDVIDGRGEPQHLMPQPTVFTKGTSGLTFKFSETTPDDIAAAEATMYARHDQIIADRFAPAKVTPLWGAPWAFELTYDGMGVGYWSNKIASTFGPNQSFIGIQSTNLLTTTGTPIYSLGESLNSDSANGYQTFPLL